MKRKNETPILDDDAAKLLGLGAESRGAELAIGRRISHFEIESELGAGGMGRVFVARDIDLDRKVALKFLSEELIGDEEAQARFLREARSASALDHDHIGTIFEAGEEGDDLYIAMAYYEGETLAERLRRGEVPLEEAISILRQMASGLAAAHAAGIVHRDIKPANVMLAAGGPSEGGMVKILDFGLARPARHEGDATALTATGTTLGTVAYMSPEQARGLPVDQRTDLWSLGVIAYELLAGRAPFGGAESVEVLSQVLTAQPDPLDHPDLPTPLVDLVGSLLAKDLDRRIGSAVKVEEVLRAVETGGEAPTVLQPPKQLEVPRTGAAADLRPQTKDLPGSGSRRWMGVAAAITALAAAVLIFVLRAEPVAAFTEGETLVLTDFVNQTGDPVFDGTLKQGLKVKLEESPYLDILSAEHISETLRLMGRSLDETITEEVGREICQRHNSRATIASSITSLGSSYALTLDALDCATGRSLASHRVTARSKEEVLGALGQASTALRRDLGETLASLEHYDAPLEQATTSSLEALQAYSRGMQLLYLGAAEALPFLERAVELDPDFVLARGQLGNELINLGRHMEARAHIERAYELVGRVSEYERCNILTLYYPKLLHDFERGVEVSEGCARAYPRVHYHRQDLAAMNSGLGRYEAALEHALVAVELRPFSPGNQVHLRLAYAGLGEIDKAREVVAFVEANASKFRPGLATRLKAANGDLTDEEFRDYWIPRRDAEGTPGEVMGLYYFAIHLAGKGRAEEARKLLDRSAELATRTGDMSNALYARLFESWSLGLLGFREEARGILLETVEMLGDYEDENVAGQLILFGEHESGEAMLARVAAARPHSTFLHRIYAPALEGFLAQQNGDSEAAVRLMERSRPYDGAQPGLWGLLLRGRAYLANGQAGDAVRQFEDLISYQYVARPNWWLVIELAYLGRARAQTANGDPEAARASYEEFLEHMQEADEGVPVVEEAREEYAALLEELA